MYKILGEDVSAHLKAKNTPGVFSQGLVVYAGSGDEVLFEQLLDVEIVSQMASFCEENGVSLIAYSGDDIVSVRLTLRLLPECRKARKHKTPVVHLNWIVNLIFKNRSCRCKQAVMAAHATSPHLGSLGDVT